MKLFERSVSRHVLHFLDVTDLCPLRAASTVCCVTVERSLEMKELRQLFASLRDNGWEDEDVIDCAIPSLYPLPRYLQSPAWRGILTTSVSSNTLSVLRNILCLRAVQDAVWQNRHIVGDMLERGPTVPESRTCSRLRGESRSRLGQRNNFVLIPTTRSNHIMIYHGILIGLAGSLYAGRVFHFKLELIVTGPEHYPFGSPEIYFIAPSPTRAQCVRQCLHEYYEFSPGIHLNKLVQSLSRELFNSDIEHLEHFAYPLSSNIGNIMADSTIPPIISSTASTNGRRHRSRCCCEAASMRDQTTAESTSKATVVA